MPQGLDVPQQPGGTQDHYKPTPEERRAVECRCEDHDDLMRSHPGFYSLALSEYESDGRTWYVAHYRMRPSWADQSIGSSGDAMTRFESAGERAQWMRARSLAWRLTEAVAYKEKYEELVRQVAAQPGIKKLRKWLSGPAWRD